MASKYIIILTTGKKKDIEKISKLLIRKKLVACVQMVPIKSIYWWKRKIEHCKEFLCLIKTKKKIYLEIEKEIKKIHSYKVPEIIAIPIVVGSENYLNWIDKEIIT